jgi:hypothetical protein
VPATRYRTIHVAFDWPLLVGVPLKVRDYGSMFGRGVLRKRRKLSSGSADATGEVSMFHSGTTGL